jgi:hypothetical protein
MTLGKIIYYILYVPMLITSGMVWAIDKINWTVGFIFEIAKDMHKEIKEF